MLTEYVALKDADERRRSAVRNNPVAAKMYACLEECAAGVVPTELFDASVVASDPPRPVPIAPAPPRSTPTTTHAVRGHPAASAPMPSSSRSESAQEKTRRRGAASKPRARGTDGRAYRRADGVRFAAGRGRGRRRRARKPGRRRRVAAVQPPARTRRRSRAEQTRRAHRGQHEHEPIHRARGVAERWKGLRGRRRRGFDPRGERRARERFDRRRSGCGVALRGRRRGRRTRASPRAAPQPADREWDWEWKRRNAGVVEGSRREDAGALAVGLDGETGGGRVSAGRRARGFKSQGGIHGRETPQKERAGGHERGRRGRVRRSAGGRGKERRSGWRRRASAGTPGHGSETASCTRFTGDSRVTSGEVTREGMGRRNVV